MPLAMTDDGIRLYYEETGSGTPLIFVHEFAGDHRSWEAQMRHFGRRYRCVAFNARGYPPSDVPASQVSYSQGRAAADIRSVLDHLSLESAHIVGLSMGGFATLHFGFRYAARALSLLGTRCSRFPNSTVRFIAYCALCSFTLPTSTDRGEDFVWAEFRTCGEGHGLGFQFKISVIGVAVVFSRTVLIKNRRSGATSYSADRPRSDPPPTIRVWNNGSAVPGSSVSPLLVIATAINLASGAM